MPFKALVNNEECVSILQGEAEWDALRAMSRAEPQSVRCVACGHPMILKGPTDKVIAHFAHRIGADCVFVGETPYHRYMKMLILMTARTAGCEVAVEKWLERADGNVKADTLITRPDGSRLAIEFQNSHQSAERYIERTTAYCSLGLPVLWLTWRKFAKALRKNRDALGETEILFLYDDDYTEFLGQPPEAFREVGFSSCSVLQWVAESHKQNRFECPGDWSQAWCDALMEFRPTQNSDEDAIVSAVRAGRLPDAVFGQWGKDGYGTLQVREDSFGNLPRISITSAAWRQSYGPADRMLSVYGSLEETLRRVCEGKPAIREDWLQAEGRVLRAFQERLSEWAVDIEARRKAEAEAEELRRIKALKSRAREQLSWILNRVSRELPVWRQPMKDMLLPYLSARLGREVTGFESLSADEWQWFVNALEEPFWDFTEKVWAFTFPDALSYSDYLYEWRKAVAIENQWGERGYPTCYCDREHIVFCGLRRASGKVGYHRACKACGQIGYSVRLSSAQKASIPIFSSMQKSAGKLRIAPTDWGRCPADAGRRSGFIPPRCTCGDAALCWHQSDRLPSGPDVGMAAE